MNDFRKLAKFVQDNLLRVEPFKVKGTAGGFDDYSGYKFFLGRHELEGVSLTTSTFQLDTHEEVLKTLPLLEQALNDVKHVDVIDMESLESYLKRERSK